MGLNKTSQEADSAVLTLLKDLHADVNIKTNMGCAPIHYAVANDAASKVR